MNGINEKCAVYEPSSYKATIFLPGAAVRKYILAVALAFLATVMLFANAYAQKAGPFVTAGEHAGFAAKAKTLTKIHLHLHHALNCLEGSTGRDYKNVPDNPCTGKGALQTLPKNSPRRVRAQKAIALARVGVTLKNAKAAHYVAQAVHSILTEGRKM